MAVRLRIRSDVTLEDLKAKGITDARIVMDPQQGTMVYMSNPDATMLLAAETLAPVPAPLDPTPKS